MIISPTFYGKLMARYYLNFKTMKLFRQIKGDESLRDLFDLLTQCHELNDFNIRVTDKKILNELNHSKTSEIIRFPIKGRVKTVVHKVSCLMQAVLGSLTISDYSMQQESTKIMKTAEKVSKCK